MYVFGVVVTDADETPTGRASEALRAELPSLFPEHRFEFLNPNELPQIGKVKARALLFHVLASQICGAPMALITLVDAGPLRPGLARAGPDHPGLGRSHRRHGKGENSQLSVAAKQSPAEAVQGPQRGSEARELGMEGHILAEPTSGMLPS